MQDEQGTEIRPEIRGIDADVNPANPRGPTTGAHLSLAREAQSPPCPAESRCCAAAGGAPLRDMHNR